MARRCSATSLPQLSRLKGRYVLVCALLAALWSSEAQAGLYSAVDQVLVLDADSVSRIFNASSAFMVEFYATWCGHCSAFAPVWKNLASDVSEWKPAVDMAALDCADENNRRVCTGFGITGYPSIKFFPAYSGEDFTGESLREFPRDVRGLRRLIIDKLESHKEPSPPACPPLEPASAAEIDGFFENNNVQHLALVFEENNSYVGREVILDLLQYENITVRRVLSSEKDLVSRLGVTDFPSCYLYYTPTNYSRLPVLSEARAFYSYALQRLPSVVRAGRPYPAINDLQRNQTEEPWREFNRTRVYMSDLESALHYSLRVELSAHSTISGDALTALRHYVSVLTKYFPGRPAVKGALKAVGNWLQDQKETQISYSDFRTALDSTVLSGEGVLPAGVRWVGCQGSRPQFRGYPCAVWTLFHVLTVEANASGSTDPLEILQAMREYVSSFFGCRPCASHFASMAQDVSDDVTTPSTAVWWLWSRHNRVNSRLAGEPSEDPHFPKIQWPPPELCPKCHGLMLGGEHTWNKDEVIAFLRNYFSSERILPDYLQEESEAVAQQKALLTAAQQQKDTTRRKARETQETPSTQLGQEEEEEEEEEEDEAAAVATEEEEPEGMGGATEAKEPHPAGEEPSPLVQTPPPGRPPWARRRISRRPAIVGLKLRQTQEDIVDLDLFVNQHYKAKALRALSAMAEQQQEDAEERRPDSVRRMKRELFDQQEALLMEPYPHPQGKRWMSLLSVGFSRLDVSLCVLFYLLSTLCLTAMYLYFKLKWRLRRAKVALP
ncbi:sulfhydryl oxidase 1 isoform X1 [Pygocentrus nattereri]|uniref:Sulfhydryl oxidase n=1 Tax=Pygocentrus nattereri TaxID=42514 RepID=A0AAR2M539_PYGNA|nr:sulfhydryl oxidase 1 isoform X1 [Pygocentrus nattereri]